jgi:hypothetical protein
MEFIIRSSGSNHLGCLLDSLRKCNFFSHWPKVQVVECSVADDYLSEYEGMKELSIRRMTEKEKSLFLDLSPKQRVGLSASLAIRSSKEHGLCVVLEDDIIVCGGFPEKLKSFVELVSAELQEAWVGSLYTPMDDEERPGMYYVRKNYDHGNFYGTQAMIYPTYLLGMLNDHLVSRVIDNYLLPQDHAVADFLRHRIPIVSPTTCLVQHVGLESRIHSSAFHRSKLFKM